jgi:hypothetical protein
LSTKIVGGPVEPLDTDAEIKKYALKEYLSELGRKGGQQRTEAQRLARQSNAAKMRQAKAIKRFGRLKEK